MGHVVSKIADLSHLSEQSQCMQNHAEKAYHADEEYMIRPHNSQNLLIEF
jgi:hypothetical protein